LFSPQDFQPKFFVNSVLRIVAGLPAQPASRLHPCTEL
jgi:hypothetical protein